MASAITGTGLFTSAYVTSTVEYRDRLMKYSARWPREVPSHAAYTLHYGPGKTTINFRWQEDWGQKSMGYAVDLPGQVGPEEVLHWQEARLEEERVNLVRRTVPQGQPSVEAQAPPTDVIVACADCGHDMQTTVPEPGLQMLLVGMRPTNIHRCFYCTELRRVREENRAHLATLPRRERRRLQKQFG